MENVTTINRSQMTVKRGDIFWYDFGDGDGSVQGGKRPVLVVQNDIGNKFSPVLQVAVITSQLGKAKLPTHVEIGVESGLTKQSIVLLEQIRPINKNKLIPSGYIGRVNKSVMDKVDNAIQVSLATGEGKLFSMSREEKLAYQKAKLVISIDSALRELIQEKESMSIIKKYMAKRENRINELESYCKLNGLDYTRFYYIETQQQSRQYK